MSSVPDHFHLFALQHSQRRRRIFRILGEPIQNCLAVSRLKKNHIEESVIGCSMERERKSWSREATIQELHEQKNSPANFSPSTLSSNISDSALERPAQITARTLIEFSVQLSAKSRRCQRRAGCTAGPAPAVLSPST